MMEEDEAIDDVVGEAIATAAEEDQMDEVDRLIRANSFMVLQQFDPETGEVEENDDGSFNVILVEIDEDSAVVAFTQEKYASEFLNEVEEDIPQADQYPAIMLDGNTLLAGLPSDCGLLINPGAPTECYLAPGFGNGDYEDED
jgi:SseB protein N-terminal domain